MWTRYRMQNWANIFCASARHTTRKQFIDSKRGAIAAHGQRAWEKRKARVFAEEKVLRRRQVQSINKNKCIRTLTVFALFAFDYWLISIASLRWDTVHISRDTRFMHENCVESFAFGIAMNSLESHVNVHLSRIQALWSSIDSSRWHVDRSV